MRLSLVGGPLVFQVNPGWGNGKDLIDVIPKGCTIEIIAYIEAYAMSGRVVSPCRRVKLCCKSASI